MGSHQKKLRKLEEDFPTESPIQEAPGQNVKNLSILSLSLAATAMLSMVMRMFIPRALGVEALGQFQFVEQLAMFLFGFMPFGIGSYINKNVPPNPGHAREIAFTIISFQTAVSVLLLAVVGGICVYLDRGQDFLVAGMLMAFWAYSETIQNTTFKKMYIVLNKVRRVGTINVIQKAIQVTAVISSLFLSGSIVDLAIAYFIASAIGMIIVSVDLVRLGVISFNFNRPLLAKIVNQSLPYFFGLILVSAFQSTDTIVLSLVGNDIETGYFSAAFRLIGVLMIVVPALDSAFIPTQSRNFVHNKPLFTQTLENIVSFLLVVSLGCSLVLGLFSDVIVRTLFGAGYEHSYKIVSFLAPVLSLTYINTVLGSSLNIASSGKLLSTIMAIGLVANVIANYFFVPLGMAYWGEGGGGLTVALTTVVSEAFIAVAIVAKFPVDLNLRKIFYRVATVALPCVAMLMYYNSIASIPIEYKILMVVVGAPLYIMIFRVLTPNDLREAVRAIRAAMKSRLKS